MLLTMLLVSIRHTPSRARYPATVNVACPGRGAAPLQRCTAEPGPTNREWYLQWIPDQQRITEPVLGPHEARTQRRLITASGPACRRDNRRSRAGSCGRASRPRRISPTADTADTWSPPDPHAEPA